MSNPLIPEEILVRDTVFYGTEDEIVCGSPITSDLLVKLRDLGFKDTHMFFSHSYAMIGANKKLTSCLVNRFKKTYPTKNGVTDYCGKVYDSEDGFLRAAKKLLKHE